MPSLSFNPSTDISNLAGKVILITGGTAGLGAGSITELAKHSPSHIFFSGRNQSNADELMARIHKTSPSVPLTFIKCDISSFASVKAAAETFKAKADRLDILMLNAGIMATPPGVSEDGYEIQFATNHLGHALLVKLLLPTLLSTASQPTSDVRIINLTSIAYKQAPSQGIDFATLKSPQASLGGMIPGPRWSRYGQSKLAQLLYTRQLAQHYSSILCVAVHPGVVMTGLFEGLPFWTALPVRVINLGRETPVEQGHWQQCWAATCERGALKSGGYYEPIGREVTPATRQARDEELAERLWRWTEEQLDGWEV